MFISFGTSCLFIMFFLIIAIINKLISSFFLHCLPRPLSLPIHPIPPTFFPIFIAILSLIRFLLIPYSCFIKKIKKMFKISELQCVNISDFVLFFIVFIYVFVHLFLTIGFLLLFYSFIFIFYLIFLICYLFIYHYDYFLIIGPIW